MSYYNKFNSKKNISLGDFLPIQIKKLRKSKVLKKNGMLVPIQVILRQGLDKKRIYIKILEKEIKDEVKKNVKLYNLKKKQKKHKFCTVTDKFLMDFRSKCVIK